MNIETITLSYVEVEDRIHMAALLADKTNVRMWITQRLTSSLVKALSSHFEKEEGIPLPSVRNKIGRAHV